MVKKKHALALFPLALCFSSAPILAATTADLEKRLQDQEKKILRLENQLRGTRSAVKENRGRIADMNERLKINGFMSAGVATNDGDDVVDSFYGIGDDYTTKAINKLGIQMTFQVSENFTATAQLVSKGIKDYDVEAEWAYLTYKATNNLRFNFGRQRIPYYLLSEYLDVGYALPWVYAPIEMYNIPISAIDGVSAIYDFAFGDFNFAWQTYAGAGGGYSEQLEAEFTQNQSWGTNLTATTGDWTFRMGFTSSNLNADPEQGGSGALLIEALNTARTTLGPTLGVDLPPGGDWLGDTDNIRANYYSAGVMYDDGNLLVMGELSNLNVDDTVQPVGDAGYLTVGYRFGKWMPHVTFSKFQTDSKNDKQIQIIQEYANAIGTNAYLVGTFGVPPAIPPQAQLLPAATVYGETLYNQMAGLIQEQQSYTIGLTYDVSSRVKAKAQVTHYEGFGSNDYQTLASPASPFADVYSVDSIDGNGRFTGEPGAAGNHTAIYSFSIDAVF